jgi:hypothetical protein
LNSQERAAEILNQAYKHAKIMRAICAGISDDFAETSERENKNEVRVLYIYNRK